MKSSVRLIAMFTMKCLHFLVNIAIKQTSFSYLLFNFELKTFHSIPRCLVLAVLINC